MKVLFISPNSPFQSIGGVERALLNLIAYYKNEKDLETYVLLPTDKENYSEKVGNVTIYFDNNLSLSRDAGHKEISEKSQAFAALVEKFIKEQGVGLICAENFHIGLPASYSLLLNMVSMQYKIPLALRVHSFASLPLQAELINQLQWSLVSCVSKSVAGDCFHKGADIDFLSTDYLGVNTTEFKKPEIRTNDFKSELGIEPNSKVILSASRIVLGRKNILKEKGLINLIESFSKLSPRYPNWYLLIAVGKPPESLTEEFNSAKEMLAGYVKLHNVTDKTIIRTFKMEDMPRVYGNADIFVLPSENETFGQVFLESMACELPVIGTKVGGIPEIISDSYNGYLVVPNDASVLAQRMEKLINDELERKKFIRTGLKTVESKFTSKKQFANFHKKLESLRF